MILFTKYFTINCDHITFTAIKQLGENKFDIEFHPLSGKILRTVNEKLGDTPLTLEQAERFLKAYREGLTRGRISFDVDAVLESIIGGTDERND